MGVSGMISVFGDFYYKVRKMFIEQLSGNMPVPSRILVFHFVRKTKMVAMVVMEGVAEPMWVRMHRNVTMTVGVMDRMRVCRDEEGGEEEDQAEDSFWDCEEHFGGV